jgi:hypothetical protein
MNKAVKFAHDRPVHGFRLAHVFESPENLRAMRAAEDGVLAHARAFNGFDPAYRNGPVDPKPFRLVNGRRVAARSFVA